MTITRLAAPLTGILAATLMLAAAPAAFAAQAAPPRAAAPKLLVVISVDQFSADLYAQYRARFTGGFARLAQGAVYPSAYQSHAATETCPGHSTILTGARPARTGIIANDWIDLRAARDDKTIYCAEDETAQGSTSRNYTVADIHLKAETLGDLMKKADPASRVVAVAGKDRAAVMMGGHDIDEVWYWEGRAFASYAGRKAPPAVVRANADVAGRLASVRGPMALPAVCKPMDYPVEIAPGHSVGTGRFARPAGDAGLYRASPEADEVVLNLAADLVDEMKLGQGAATDLIAIGASATDVIGHAYGVEGAEMCLELLTLDKLLGTLFDRLDRTGVDYAVALTADHGGQDIPERLRMHGLPEATRVDPMLNDKAMSAAIGAEVGLPGRLIWGGNFGDQWIDLSVGEADRPRVLAAAVRRYGAHPQVAGVFTRAEIMATPAPKGPPETWTLLERAQAAYDPERSGDFVVALKPRVTPIANPGPGHVATHGSFWDYDRRVPVLFWRKGMAGFEQPMSIETVDIMPTLANMIGLDLAPGQVDGRCIMACR